eukprot:jgi/Mesen1/3827/ME000207S02837
MQPTDESLKALSQCFLQTLQPDPQPRKQAEAYLKQAADQPGYGLTVLGLITSQGVDEQVRQAAAVNFKNHVKYHWSPDEPDAPGAPVALQIKGHIVELMLSSSPRIQAQISEALAIVSSFDFPERWQTLLPELVSRLAASSAAPPAAAPSAVGVPDAKVKAAVCENINLYAEKNEEEFSSFLPTFVTDVWNLLQGVTLAPAHDRLAITAIRFLTAVARSVHHALFADPGILQQVCEKIVIPNARLRDEDEELFEINPVEYIRRDMEGSDSDTRRRMACELVKGLAQNYEQQVITLFSVYVSAMLAEYAASPADSWKAKDCAIYLVVALAVRQKTAAAGATATNELVKIGDFFSAQILPELRAPDVNDQAVLKADALKFLTTFRGQIPKAATLELLPRLIAFLGAESNVVHSYAANCIERMLVVRDPGGQPRFAPADLAPFTERILLALFNALQLPDSGENQYVMKCIMRVVSCADVRHLAPQCIGQLAQILTRVCRNPTQPSFNHYLFEAVAALVRRVTSVDPSLLPTFEQSLFPVLQATLEQDIVEFAPYVFQILALLIEMRPSNLPESYMAIFPVLVTPLLWERAANVPALVRLLQILERNQLPPVLGVFQKLVASRSSDHHGFFILNTVVENLSPDALQPFLHTIWALLFNRLQTPKFVRSLLIFMALFVVKHGVAAVADSIQRVQAGIFVGVLQTVWVQSLPTITGDIEPKLCAVAATKILCDSSDLQLLDSVLTLMVRPEEDRAGAAAGDDEREHDDVADLEEASGYTASYAQLHNAGKREEDPVPDVKDVRQLLTASLGQLAGRSPGRYSGIIQQSLQPANRDALQQYCSTYQETDKIYCQPSFNLGPPEQELVSETQAIYQCMSLFLHGSSRSDCPHGE